jgi:hypothetical protein
MKTTPFRHVKTDERRKIQEVNSTVTFSSFLEHFQTLTYESGARSSEFFGTRKQR